MATHRVYFFNGLKGLAKKPSVKADLAIYSNIVIVFEQCLSVAINRMNFNFCGKIRFSKIRSHIKLQLYIPYSRRVWQKESLMERKFGEFGKSQAIRQTIIIQTLRYKYY